MNFDVFISYPHQDKATADAACAAIEAAGMRCWIAPRDVAPGTEWATAIVDAIDGCRVMVLIFSSSANQSKQIHREVQRAFDNNVPVVPFRVENVLPEKSLAYYMGPVHWLDAITPPVTAHLQKLVEAIVAFVRVKAAGAESAAAELDNTKTRIRAAQALHESIQAPPRIEGQPLPNKAVPQVPAPAERRETRDSGLQLALGEEARLIRADVARVVPAIAAPRNEPLSQTDASGPTLRIKHGFDSTRLVLYGFAAVLVLLIVLPMSWLVYYAFSDPAGGLTLNNFGRLFSESTFLEPLVTTFILATSTSLICCVFAAPMGWLVARTDMPLARTVRLLVTASFVTPPFLGAIAWELLAAPNSGLLNKLARVLFGLEADQHVFDIYSFPGLIFVISCYTFPYVFVLVANALDRTPGDLEDASSILGGTTWDTARRVTIPLVLPAILAGGLVAFLQAMTLFGSPAILALPAGFHTMTTKIWSLFQYPPKPELAAAAALPLLILTVILLRGEHMILGRRSYSVIGGKNSDPRIIRLGGWRWAALGFCFVVLLNPVFLPYGALFNASFSKVASQPIWFDNFTFQNLHFVFFELSATKLALTNTFILGIATATLGTILAVVIAYLTAREAVTGHRVLGFLATAPVAIPGIVLGVGLFLSYTRPPLVLYGTLWILLLAFLTLSLPAAYQQMQSAFRAIHPELEDASRILGATRLRSLWQITAPLLSTSVIATWCFVFVGTIRELSAAIMLFTSETKVISVLIFDLNESGDLAAISVLGFILLIVTFGIVALANRLRIGGGEVRIRNN